MLKLLKSKLSPIYGIFRDKKNIPQLLTSYSFLYYMTNTTDNTQLLVNRKFK